MATRRKSRFQFSLRTALCVYILVAAAIGAGFWAGRYYQAWKIVDGWRAHPPELRGTFEFYPPSDPIYLEDCDVLLPPGEALTDEQIYGEWGTELRKLRRLPPDAVVWALRRALQDADSHQRYLAVAALGHWGPQAATAIPELVEIALDPHADKEMDCHFECTHEEAIRTMRKIGPAAVHALRRIADLPDRVCFGEAVNADGTSVPLLVFLDEPLKESYFVFVRAWAARAVRDLTPDSPE
jgi:hypothetical protein